MSLNRKGIVLGIGILLVVGIFACDGPDDLTLASNVKEKLAADKTIPMDSIKVTILASVVTLSGVVNSDAERAKAEQIVKAIDGVDSVINKLTVKTASIPSAQPAPSINSKLSLTNIGGKINFSGVVPDEQTKQAILDQLKAAYGEANISGDIAIDASAKPAGWLTNLGAVLSDFKLPGAELNFDGDEIRVAGSIADTVKTDLVDKLKSIYGANFNIGFVPAAPVNAEAAVQEATQKAFSALKALKPGFTAQDLVAALNLEIINFPSGSAAIPKESIDLLKQSAESIKAAPKGTVLEVGGNTDNQGSTAANQQLSQRRAEAVRTFLIKLGVKPASLTAKGYGASKPVASNDTEEGRFKNRRIEYSVVK